MVNVIAYYGDATSCTKYSLDPIDYQDAITRPDKAKWSLSPQSGTIIDKSTTLPVIARWDLVTGYPNNTAWQPGLNGRNSDFGGYSRGKYAGAG